jgi:hypothetical protein
VKRASFSSVSQKCQKFTGINLKENEGGVGLSEKSSIEPYIILA